MNGAMDTWNIGEILYRGHKCVLDPDPIEFLEDLVFSQIAITESSASCAFNSIAASPIGKLFLDQNKTN